MNAVGLRSPTLNTSGAVAIGFEGPAAAMDAPSTARRSALPAGFGCPSLLATVRSGSSALPVHTAAQRPPLSVPLKGLVPMRVRAFQRSLLPLSPTPT